MARLTSRARLHFLLLLLLAAAHELACGRRVHRSSKVSTARTYEGVRGLLPSRSRGGPPSGLRPNPGRFVVDGASLPDLTGACREEKMEAHALALRKMKTDDIFISRVNCREGVCPEISGAERVPPELLPLNTESALGSPARRWGRCSVVGNSGAVLQAEHGQSISESDVVWRFNAAPTSRFEKHVGNVTTHRWLNRKWMQAYMGSDNVPLKFRRTGGRSFHPLEPNVQLVVKGDQHAPLFMERMSSRENFTVLIINQMNLDIPSELLAKSKECFERRIGKQLFGGPRSTSGFQGILILNKLCDSVHVYGIGENFAGGPYHYYLHGHKIDRLAAKPDHSFIVESLVAREMARANLIELCLSNGCIGDRNSTAL